MRVRELIDRFGLAGVLAIALLVYWPMLGFGPLHWDDYEMVVANPAFRPVSVEGIAHYWAHPLRSLWMPLTTTLWGVLASMGGATAADAPASVPFRLVSLLLHSSGGVMAFLIGRRVFATRAAGVLTAAVMLLHPLQVEAVAWMTGTKDLLAGTLSLAAIWLSVRAVQQERHAWKPLAFAIALIALAMLAKPSAVSMPIACGLVMCIARPRQWHVIAITVSAMLLIAVPIMVVAKAVQPAVNVAVPSLPDKLLAAGSALGFYGAKLALPVRLTIDYGLTPDVLSRSWGRLVLAGAFALIVGIACVRTRDWRPVAMLGALVAGVGPVLGFVPFEFQQYSSVSDHYMYAAMLGPALLVAWACVRWPAMLGVAAGLALGWAVLAHVQVWTWRSDSAIFNHAIAVNPRTLAGHRTLGYLAAQANRPADARRLYETALASHPRDPLTHYNYANLLLAAHDPAQAITHYAAIDPTRFPDAAAMQNNWGIALIQLDDPAAALAKFEAAIEASPRNAAYLANAGAAALRAGDASKAQSLFIEALTIDPRQPQASRGMLQLQRSRMPD